MRRTIGGSAASDPDVTFARYTVAPISANAATVSTTGAATLRVHPLVGA
jgi:hypothetical protein